MSQKYNLVGIHNCQPLCKRPARLGSNFDTAVPFRLGWLATDSNFQVLHNIIFGEKPLSVVIVFVMKLTFKVALYCVRFE